MAEWSVAIEHDAELGPEHFEIEANTSLAAAELVYNEWAPTSWHSASVDSLSIDLEASEFAANCIDCGRHFGSGKTVFDSDYRPPYKPEDCPSCKSL